MIDDLALEEDIKIIKSMDEKEQYTVRCNEEDNLSYVNIPKDIAPNPKIKEALIFAPQYKEYVEAIAKILDGELIESTKLEDILAGCAEHYDASRSFVDEAPSGDHPFDILVSAALNAENLVLSGLDHSKVYSDEMGFYGQIETDPKKAEAISRPCDVRRECVRSLLSSIVKYHLDNYGL